MVVISPDPDLEPLVATAGARLSVQRGLGLNRGLDQARGEALADGVDRLAVLHGDLPTLVTARRCRPAHRGRWRATDGGHRARRRRVVGTNGLALSPPGVIDFHFGTGSFEAHRKAGQARRRLDHRGAPAGPVIRHRHARGSVRVAGRGERRVSVTITALDGIPEVQAGDDLAALIARCTGRPAGRFRSGGRHPEGRVQGRRAGSWTWRRSSREPRRGTGARAGGRTRGRWNWCCANRPRSSGWRTAG